MKTLQTQYEPYCSSWSKFLGCFLMNAFLEGAQQVNSKICSTKSKHIDLMTLYFIHNLYVQYQYNKSLEHEIKVEINGVEETANASPKYFDWYTGYNVLCALEFAMRTMSFFSDKPYQDSIGSTAIKLGLISKLISLKDKYLDFQYTDSQGNIISPEIVESGFIGYIDDSRDNEAIEITLDNEAICISE